MPMIFDKLFRPDYMFLRFSDVTPEFCRKNDITALISDIDNTLVTYDDPEPTEEVLSWICSLEAAGVKLAFVSNNEEARVLRFNSSLGFPAYPKSGKPGTKCIFAAMAKLGADAARTASLGDQLFTDVCGAKRAGLRMILVPPIKDKKTPFFRFKRALEYPFMKRYLRDEGIEMNEWGI